MFVRDSSSKRDRDGILRARARAATAALALVTLALPASASAERDTAARKFGRGVAGVTLGVLEIPGNVVQESRTNGVASGVTIGLAVGLGKFVARELVGAYEIVTAPFPLPAAFAPVLQPEFAWNYFESEPGRIYGFGDTYLSEEAMQIDRISGASVERRSGALIVRFPESANFAVGSAQPTTAATARFKQLARVLRANPDARIFVAGHTDSTGDTAFNRGLSLKRAVAVRNILVAEGVSPNRIDFAAYGDASPVASNDTREGRAINRRVEIELRASGVGAYR
jgi:putative exosortase-associated protein (TIGR04073 family)